MYKLPTKYLQFFSSSFFPPYYQQTLLSELLHLLGLLIRKMYHRLTVDRHCPRDAQMLAHAFVQFYKDGRHHKCCLYADGAPAYVATVSINNESTRLSISKILFNRQRFIGKCDGDLDYAQCGDSVFDRTDSKIDEYVLLAMLEAERILTKDFPYEDVDFLWEMC